MVGKSLWQQIKDVVDCDQKIRQMQQDITSHQAGIVQDQALIKQREAEIISKKQQLLQAQKNAKLNELTVNELKAAEDSKRHKLDNVSNQKEYKGFEKEIETLSRQRSVQEELVVKQWFAVDALQKDLETKEQQFASLKAEKEHDAKVKSEITHDLENKLASQRQEREAALHKLPPEWITQYERMKHSVADPIVPMLGTSCSSCFYAIPHQDVSKLKQGNVIVCRNCYRFLFYDENAEQNVTKASY